MEKQNLVSNILDGLDRLGATARADDWAAAEATELTPTQAGILIYLKRRAPARLQQVAGHLAVSLPSASASVEALVRKKLVIRRKDASDARARALELSGEGKAMVQRLTRQPSRLRAVVAAMPAAEQADFFLHIVMVVRALQVSGAIPVQRLCVTCAHFRPFAHAASDAPHHCALVNAAFGTRDLRIDCAEHQDADPAARTAIWTAFNKGDASS
ncbi:MAG: MarR family winged helix-turn-helix transcriptional regulator, partial [bacterium]|nr:MarR family winged helix-turn-helix transcriptional regulator [bacterium]